MILLKDCRASCSSSFVPFIDLCTRLVLIQRRVAIGCGNFRITSLPQTSLLLWFKWTRTFSMMKLWSVNLFYVMRVSRKQLIYFISLLRPLTFCPFDWFCMPQQILCGDTFNSTVVFKIQAQSVSVVTANSLFSSFSWKTLHRAWPFFIAMRCL